MCICTSSKIEHNVLCNALLPLGSSNTQTPCITNQASVNINPYSKPVTSSSILRRAATSSALLELQLPLINLLELPGRLLQLLAYALF